MDAGGAQPIIVPPCIPSLPTNNVNPISPPVAVLANTPPSGSHAAATAAIGTTKDNAMPSGTTLSMMPPAGAASSASANTSVVPVHAAAGIGVGFPKPHPGDGSMDFSKTEMVTPETSLNMSIAAFLAR